MVDWRVPNCAMIEALLPLSQATPGLGFWKLFWRLRRQSKKRIPTRDPLPLVGSATPNHVCSADFMGDSLYHGTRFRTFNVLDDFSGEALSIKIDTSLTRGRLIRVFEQLRRQRRPPHILEVDTRPGFLGANLTRSCTRQGIFIDYIEPGKLNQKAYVEHFNRSYRTELLDVYLFTSLADLIEVTWRWMLEYNEERGHDSLGQMGPAQFYENARSSTFEAST